MARSRTPKVRGGSTKVSTDKRKKLFDKSTNLGLLMKKNRDVEDVLYPYVSNVGMVYEDMDFTIEEFADITGADLEELMQDLAKVVK